MSERHETIRSAHNQRFLVGGLHQSDHEGGGHSMLQT